MVGASAALVDVVEVLKLSMELQLRLVSLSDICSSLFPQKALFDSITLFE